uniref:non-specific serine/threonine protein kinase n=1 Tax=Setaria viridis TaxID=4556 RepID=A0A4U6VMU2_SETVI|nr:hypothetical protein SEVIR_2G032000v2 [Setaria viridis]
MPNEMGNLINVVILYLDGNKISGSIPATFGNLTNMRNLSLFDNQLSGTVPREFANLTGMVKFSIGNNSISGSFPSDVCKGGRLQMFVVCMNNLTDPVPASLRTCNSLTHIDISFNKFTGDIFSNFLTGEIPPEIGDLTNLYTLHLTNNQLSGPIPSQFGQLSNLQLLHLGLKKLSGQIPEELGRCNKLLSLYLNNNSLTGNLPGAIGNLVNLQIMLGVSSNKLSGRLPRQLGNLAMSLRQSQRLPSTYNARHHKGKEKFHSLMIAVLVPVGAVIALTIVAAVMFFYKKEKQQERVTTEIREVFSVWNFDGKLAFEDIVRATENFSDKYIIGVGGYGSVYKAQLQDGHQEAVKKLHPTEEEIDDERRLHDEIEILVKIRQRSIVKLYGFCSHPHYKFLVYDYMERGSLCAALQQEDVAKEMDWTRRIALVKDVAHAISYLHHDCSPPIIHRDITSNNILLGRNLKAHVSDFGTARILKPDSSNWSALAGTYGYIAPGMSKTFCLSTANCYYFGVVVLEVLLGKHPGDLLQSHLEDHMLVKEFLDQRPPQPTKIEENDVTELAQVALACLQASPQARPTMKEVYQGLNKSGS